MEVEQELDDHSLSLQDLLRKIEKLYQELTGEHEGLLTRLDRRDDRVQKAIKSTIELINHCKEATDRAHLFSKNETLDDLTTESIPFLRLDFFKGCVLQQRAAKNGQTLSARERWSLAEEVLQACTEFVERLQAYSIVSEKELTPRKESVGGRALKIQQYKEQLDLKNKRDVLQSRLARGQVEESNLREYYLAQLTLDYSQCVALIKSVTSEMQLLEQAIDQPGSQSRTGQAEASSTHDWRLDVPSSSPLLSRNGRPLRPFTILPSNKTRAEVREQVFRPGHRLPTMSIDEYLENEQRRGNIIGPGNTQSSTNDTALTDDDDDNLVDLQTYKDREWDEFKDNNPRGSGNTMSNRG